MPQQHSRHMPAENKPASYGLSAPSYSTPLFISHPSPPPSPITPPPWGCEGQQGNRRALFCSVCQKHHCCSRQTRATWLEPQPPPIRTVCLSLSLFSPLSWLEHIDLLSSWPVYASAASQIRKNKGRGTKWPQLCRVCIESPWCYPMGAVGWLLLAMQF